MVGAVRGVFRGPPRGEPRRAHDLRAGEAADPRHRGGLRGRERPRDAARRRAAGPGLRTRGPGGRASPSGTGPGTRAGGQEHAEPARARGRGGAAEPLPARGPGSGGDRGAVRGLHDRGARGGARADRAGPGCDGRPGPRPPGGALLPRLLPQLLLPAALHLLRRSPAVREAATGEPGRRGRVGGGGGADRGPDPEPLAGGGDLDPRRLGLRPRGADGLV